MSAAWMDEDEQEALVYNTQIKRGLTPEQAKAYVDKIKAGPEEPAIDWTPEKKTWAKQAVHEYGQKVLAEMKAKDQADVARRKETWPKPGPFPSTDV